MQEKRPELFVKVHLITALIFIILKAVIFIAIAYACFSFVNWVLGYDNVAFVLETVSVAFSHIMSSDTPLIHDIFVDFLEDHAFDIVVGTILLYYLNKSSVLNKYWKFTDKEFVFKEGFLALSKKQIPLDKIIRVYSVPKFDYKNMGHLFIELSMRQKTLKLPWVFHVDENVKEITKRVSKFKEGILEKDIELDLQQRQVKERTDL